MAEHQPTRPEAIFASALEIANPAARAAYLEQTCGADSGLRQEVDMLLAAHAGAEAGDFMGKQPTLLNEAMATVVSANREEQAGDRIDRYKLLEPIGEGGFGVVWMAEQQEPVRRRVALKVIKLGMDTKQVIARFEAERQALALMDHPNIAKVLDGGTTGGGGGEAQSSKFQAQIPAGRPYFVMELIKGVPITEYCDQQRLDPRQRLELFIQVCQGVQHAHQKGIIHRDLKPSNILVAVHDDKPVPKIIDFGIAKATQQPLTEHTVFTRFQQLVGTPAYMSPEQAGMSSLDVDTRSDIYSLGVLLYELLTGRTPFSKDELLKAGFEEMCRVIREKEPPKPSTKLSGLGVEELKRVAQQRHAEPQRLGRLVRGELDWIVLKALEKDCSRRYETATAFAEDLRRHLRDEPVRAAAPSGFYRSAKFFKRHQDALTRAGIGFAAATLIVSALFLVVGKYYHKGPLKHVFAQEEPGGHPAVKSPSAEPSPRAVRREEGSAAVFRAPLQTRHQSPPNDPPRTEASGYAAESSQSTTLTVTQAEEVLVKAGRFGAGAVATIGLPAPQATASLEVRLGTILPKGLGQDLILTKLAEGWRRESGGTVELKRAPGGSKDGEAGIVRKLASRNYQAALLTGVGLSQLDRDAAALQGMPLTFRDWNEVDFVRDHVRDGLEQGLVAKGYVVLFWADSGWVNLFSTQPAQTPDDFRKLRLFTWVGNPDQIEIMQSLGFKPVALETDYIHANFVSGMIDAAPLPPTFATAVQIPQVATHVLDINWSPIVGAAIVRKDVWEQIPAPVREKLRAVNERAGVDMQAEGRRFHDATLAALRKEPRMHVYVPTEEQRAQWDRLGEELGPKVRGHLVPEEIYDEVQRLLRSYRAGPLDAGKLNLQDRPN